MKEITNEKDYRIGYALLRLIAKDEGESIKRYAIELKRNLRQYASKKPVQYVGLGFSCERRIIKDYGIDGYIEIVSIPEVFDKIEDSETDGPGAESFFRDFIEIQALPSAYDCTGQSFTAWHKFVKRNGQYWVYHEVAIDV